MSDTTKINKARVNGVLYDLGGSGGAGGVSGAWLAPGELIQSGYIDANSESSWEYMTIDPEALVAQLEKAGIDVDKSPFMDSGEDEIVIVIGRYLQPSNNIKNILIQIQLSPSDMMVSLLRGNFQPSASSPREYSLKQLIYSYFSNVTDLYCNVPTMGLDGFSALVNYIQIQYSNANTILRYYIPDMSEFCDEVFVEYNSSSES